jgi:hypothetical protein
VAEQHRVPRIARRLASYTRVRTLDDLFRTFEARARQRMAWGEQRIRERRREATKDIEALHDPLSRYGSRKPSLNEYEGHE